MESDVHYCLSTWSHLRIVVEEGLQEDRILVPLPSQAVSHAVSLLCAFM